MSKKKKKHDVENNDAEIAVVISGISGVKSFFCGIKAIIFCGFLFALAWLVKNGMIEFASLPTKNISAISNFVEKIKLLDIFRYAIDGTLTLASIIFGCSSYRKTKKYEKIRTENKALKNEIKELKSKRE